MKVDTGSPVIMSSCCKWNDKKMSIIKEVKVEKQTQV